MIGNSFPENMSSLAGWVAMLPYNPATLIYAPLLSAFLRSADKDWWAGLRDRQYAVCRNLKYLVITPPKTNEIYLKQRQSSNMGF